MNANYNISFKEKYLLIKIVQFDNLLENELTKNLAENKNIIVDLSDFLYSKTLLDLLTVCKNSVNTLKQSFLIVSNSKDNTIKKLSPLPTISEAEDFLFMEELERDLLS